MLISDGSSDVCSSDLCAAANLRNGSGAVGIAFLVCLQGGRTTLVVFGQVVIALLAPTSSVIFAQLGYRRKTRAILDHRSDERRLGKEWVSTCESRWSTYLINTNT